MKTTHIFDLGDEIYFKNQVLVGDKVYEIELSGPEYTSKSKFSDKMSKLISSFAFYGSEAHLQMIKEKCLDNNNIKRVKGLIYSGIHKIGEDYILLLPDAVFDSHGKRSDIVLKKDVHDKIQYSFSENKQNLDINQIFKRIIQSNDKNIMLTILGFIGMIPFAARFRENLDIGIPALMLTGPKGSGKTTIARAIIGKFFGLKDAIKDIRSLTAFVLMRRVSSSNLFPVILDEYKVIGKKSVDSIVKKVSNLLRSAYDSNDGERGRQDQSVVTYPFLSPVVLIGEISVSEPALLERVILVDFQRERTQDMTETLFSLSTDEIMEFGKQYILWTLTVSDDYLKILWDEMAVKRERSETNVALIKMGLFLMSSFVNNTLFDPKKINDQKFQDLRNRMLDLLSSFGNKQSIVDQMLRQLILMVETKNTDMGDFGKSFLAIDDEQVHIHIPTAYAELMKFLQQVDYSDEILSESDFKRQLEKEDYFIKKNSPKHFLIKTRKAMVLDKKKLINRDILEGEESK
jgi:hypothetical protein